MNGVLLHVVHKISLQNKTLSIKVDIVAITKIYFIHTCYSEFFEKFLTFFEVGLWTSTQQKSVNEFLPILFEKNGFRMDQFKVILTQDTCDTIQRNDYIGFGNPCVYLKPLNNV